MSNNTQQQILDGARECFFQHGYKASNMSLISQYAGFSRVTLHKYFKNKDLVFRAVCNDYQMKCHDACLPILDAQLGCWDAIQQSLGAWSKSIFESVNDRLVYKDLHYYAQQVAEDIFLDAHLKLESVLCELINKGTKHGELDLNKLQLSDIQLAKILIATINGINSNTPPELIHLTTEQTLNIFRLAAEPIN
jgi:AcrR family transcriptional regulator